MSELEEILLRALLLIPIFILNGWIAIKIREWQMKRRQTRFIAMVRVEYPDSRITFVSAASSDREVLSKLEEDFRNR